MRDWEEREKRMSTGGISTALFLIIAVFSIGFVVGVFWGLWYFTALEESAQLTPPAFGGGFSEATIYKNYHITLYDGIGIRDEVQVLP